MSKNAVKEFGRARDLINGAERVLIISHIRPDADTIGANCALKDVLKRLQKEVVSVCADPVPENCLFIKGANEFVNDFPVNEFDLFVSVDCGDETRTGFHEKAGLFDGRTPFINFDHHDSNSDFGNVNVVVKDACSTSFILFEFFKFCGFKITPETATAFLAGIYFDTGSLMHSNTRADSFTAVADLIRVGGGLKTVVKNLFRTVPVEQMRLWGKILERARVNENGVVTSAAMESDYTESGARPEDTSGAVDFLNSVSGSKFCVLLSEDQKGEVKGSVRTQKDDLDISKVASMLGGGGHKKAAGFGVPGRIKEERVFRIVER